MGEKGAIFASEGKFIRTIPPEVKVLSTVGAGDAMVAGLVAGESIGCSFEERARLATAFSAAALTKLGPGRTSRERVYPLMKDIKIEEVRT
ncbi:MAG: 1-phosphofructokinase, partial [Synergistales bacterium]|nr:1-phosphofructokinase [Synergistales bacterium]